MIENSDKPNPPKSFGEMAPEDFLKESNLEKISERLLWLKRRDEVKFNQLFKPVSESDEFAQFTPDLPGFVFAGGEVARKFIADLGFDYDLFVFPEYISENELFNPEG